MKFRIPTYEFTIDDTDESGVSTISLVTQPAMKSSFIAFNKNTAKQQYVFIKKDEKQYKGIVAGLSMIPNKLIYRIDMETGEEYNGYFSAETIEKIRTKYHKNVQNLTSVNLEHSNAFVDAYLVESYILDSQQLVDAVKAKGIQEACLGAWYTAFKVENREVFDACLNGTFTGFSVEAFLDRELKMSINNFNKTNTKKMKKNLVERLRERVNKILEEANFEDMLCPELNAELSWGAVGETVTKTYINTSNVEVTEPVGAGEFVLEDGQILVVDANSALTEIRPAVEQPEVEVPEVEMPEVEVPVEPVVSGDTVPVVEVPLPELPETEEEMACKKKKLEEETVPEVIAEAETAPVISDFEKPLGSFIDVTKDGKYSIECVVEAGVIKSATVKSLAELMSAQDALVAEIAALKAKLKEPIGEPILTDKKLKAGEIRELTVYEKVAQRNGLPIL